MVVARRAGGGVTVPVLVTPEGVLGESEQILAWVDERTPADASPLSRRAGGAGARCSGCAGASTASSGRAPGG